MELPKYFTRPTQIKTSVVVLSAARLTDGVKHACQGFSLSILYHFRTINLAGKNSQYQDFQVNPLLY